jgi:hypothetical protein
MAFQTPITIREALKNIEANRYLLPAIQREVVWSKDQIARLFDSLMRDYPIGSFLFWNVEEENSKEYTFYEFMTRFHQLKNRHLRRHELTTKRSLIGVLDGQQRLTALNIGLRGTYSERRYRSWAHIESNYPKTHLYLRLDQPADQNDLGMEYDFRFLTPESAINDTGRHWFQVSDMLNLDPDVGVDEYLEDTQLTGQGSKFPRRTLRRLERVIHRDRVINYFLEPSQDLDKVLNIFIRVNSGGTVLSQSDLLLSIATSQWKELDARDAVHGLVDELNDIGRGFNIDKDMVLKSGLMLNDIPSVAFQVRNFNASNMSKLEASWDKVSDALRKSVRLLADFGFSDRTLTANSVVIPIAYYLHKRHVPESYFTHDSHAFDRDAIRIWITRSIIKSGVWGSGLDQLLVALRQVIANHGTDRFPVVELEKVLALRGKSLTFTEEEVRELATMSISDRRVFSLLSLLYPGMDLRNDFHVDHVFPAALFTKTKLRNGGVAEDQIDVMIDAYNRLPNLQLLEGPVNQSKQDKLPHIWAEAHIPDEGARAAYFHRQMLGTLPTTVTGFMDFYEARLERVIERIGEVIGFSKTLAEEVPDPVTSPN